MTPATASAVLRIAAGLPHPSEAHATFCEALGDKAQDRIIKMRTFVAEVSQKFGVSLERVWGDVIENAGKRNPETLVYVLAALHEAQLEGEVAP